MLDLHYVMEIIHFSASLPVWYMGLTAPQQVRFQFQNQGSNTCPLYCKAESTTGPTGKSPYTWLFVCLFWRNVHSFVHFKKQFIRVFFVVSLEL